MRPSRTAALFLVLAYIGAAPAASQVRAPADVPAAERSALVERMIRRVNYHRALNGAPPVRNERRLARAAQAHADDMVRRDYFDHRSPDSRGMQDRAISAGYPWRLLAENLGAGLSTPEQTADAWMTSPGHRANMIDPGYVDIGVGYARPPEGAGTKVRYDVYWVILLGAPAR